ncbi:putative epoxide hydrolase [Glarea lozoyensis 74030]|uniref:Putative epoxide hydrolase n=1 Tax=Glarea lozoyensis (strain ATCC 74030 / MF5533) TaxID=1104152 RepID=H0EVY8_GLAL7|nr:putative epoxide hydrolase [Glarea lozoyensis 74030]
MATKSQPQLTLQGAHIALAAAQSHAKIIGVPMNIAIVDASTNLIAFERMDGAKITSISIAMDKAFTAAGHRVVTQGGDWGSEITRAIGLQYPKHCLASNINLIEISLDTLSSFVSKIKTPLTDQEKAGVERTHWFNKEGSGYNILQGTKPHTLSFALRDPLSLLSWIFEKLHDWTDSYPWTDDEILTWVSIYQFSRAGPESSVRIYYEATHMDQNLKAKYWQFIEGPKLGLSYFPRDINLPPSEYGRTLGEVVFERRHESGGHFAAWERPEELAGDLFEMFGEGGGAGEVGRGIVQ